MTLRLVPGDLSLAALDALEVEAVAAFVGEERPLQGLSGLLDWRLCGAISRAILDGTFVPGRGEAMLLPSGGRLPAPRVFCFGLPGEDAPAREAAIRRACDVVARAGARSLALALPAGAAGSAVARAFVEAAVQAGFASQVLLGDGRALARDLAAAVREAKVDAQVVESGLRPEGRGAASLPGRGSVVR
ncbi:MAG TPA: M17 family peptidase N-terminal domain-containing protein [Anaeromyxobacteraceae bacterium]|nr:M17 family peptidase N-terminal domain-containing protein [Anaeromyxobacteraceae bacterium]